MIWFTWAIIASLCAAGLAECNRFFKLDPQLMNAWRATFALALVSVALPHMIWPDNKWFYIVAALDGVVTGIGMIMYFHLAERKTGRVSSMVIPTAAVAAYLAWWMMHPELRPELLANPGKVGLAAISATLVLFAFQKVRDNDAGRQTLVMVLPVGVAFGIVNALTKDVLGQGLSIYNTSVTYSFVQLLVCSATAWLASVPVPPRGRRSDFFDKDLLWGAACAGLCTAGMVLCNVFALSAAPQPAMPQIIMACTPVWLFILNHIRKTEDDASLPSSILILIGALGLLLSSI